MILTDLSNTIKQLWEKISFLKHFKFSRIDSIGTSYQTGARKRDHSPLSWFSTGIFSLG